MADHSSVHAGVRIPQMFDYADLGATHLNAQRKLLRALQALVQGRVLEVGLDTPPGAPSDGDAYILGSAPSGAWSGHAKDVAVWSAQKATDDTNTKVPAWEFYDAKAGWLLWDENTDGFFVFDGTSWAALATGSTITLKTDGVANGTQTILDLISGTGITITDNGDGTVTVDSTVSGGMTNPMTTAGDIIYGGASGTPTRLAVGSDGKQLTVVSGNPAWATKGKITITTESTTSRTLALGDAGTDIRCTNSSPTTITVPPNSSVAFETGTTLTTTQAGTGQVTIAAGAGVTINKRATLNAKTAGQYAVVQLKKVATDTWDLFGDLEVA